MHVYLLDTPDNGVGTASVSGPADREIRARPEAVPLPNAPIYLADAIDGCYIAAGLTGEKGDFCSSHLITGEYSLIEGIMDRSGVTRGLP